MPNKEQDPCLAPALTAFYHYLHNSHIELDTFDSLVIQHGNIDGTCVWIFFHSNSKEKVSHVWLSQEEDKWRVTDVSIL